MDYLLFPFFVAALSIPMILLLVFLSKNRDLSGAITLSRLVVSILGWMFFSCLELFDRTESGTLLWAKLTYFFIVAAPVFWYLFVLEYLGLYGPEKKRSSWGYWVVPAVVILSVFTNDFHRLIWTSVEFVPVGRFLTLQVQHGLLFFVVWAYCHGLILAGIGSLIGEGLPNKKAFRGRVYWLLASVLVIVVFSIVYIGKLVPWLRKDYTPVALAVSGLFLGIASLRHRMFHLIPTGKARLFESLDDAIVVLDEGGQVVEANRAALNLFDATEDEVLGHLLPPLCPELAAALESGNGDRPDRFEFHKTGSAPRYLKLKVIPVAGSRGRRRGRMIVASDVTSEETIRMAEREEQAFSRTLSDIAIALSETRDPSDLFSVIIKKVKQVIPCDEASLMMIEDGRIRVRHSSEAAVSELVLPLIETRNLRWMSETRLPLVIPDVTVYEGWVGSPAGSWIRAYVGAPIQIGDETIGFISLASAKVGFFGEKAAERLRTIGFHASIAIRNAQSFSKMEELATTDGLTGLYTRRHFYDLAERELDRASRHGASVSAIMVDIDHFKLVNDEHGHLAGDEVLRVVARICKANLRAYDVICRYGGEEFAILLPQADISDAVQLAERLRLRVSEERFLFPTGSVSVTISLGVAQAVPGGSELENLLGVADKALYEAKASGRNKTAKLEPPSNLGGKAVPAL